MGQDIKVSVCVVTYNQDKYLRECLESIINQKTNFDFEILVGDDYSSDNTRSIIQDFVNRYPSIVKPIFHSENIGVVKNYFSVHNRAIGEYICHMDGDDRWLPGKLQKQVDFLDANKNYSQVWCCANLIDDCSEKIGIFPSRAARLLYPKVITYREIALTYSLVGHHSTQMYRKDAKCFLNCDENSDYLDYWFAFHFALYGPAFYMKEVLSEYRKTQSESVTRNPSKRRVTVDLLSKHLLAIYEKHPNLGPEISSNLKVRHFFSTLKKHDLRIIVEALDKTANIPFYFRGFAKSFFYFFIQKIF